MFESRRGARVQTSCFHPSLSSPLQMEIKLSSNDLYPLGCQCREEDENIVPECRSRRASECCSPLSVACLRPLNFSIDDRAKSFPLLAGSIRPAHLKSNTDWRALEAGVQGAPTSYHGGKQGLTHWERGLFWPLPDQTALREGKHKDANDSLLGILPQNQRIWI